ncbi:MAG: amidohydrolase family protein [Desulfonauticus sp.]|nr:amidohydrolase family protein [Desulfonauticus sp.]
MLDVHTHIFHPKIAEKACQALKTHYAITPQGTGLLDDLLVHLETGQFSKAIVLCAATGAHQVIPANNWAIELNKHSKLIAFGTIHPDYQNWEKELSRLLKHDISGLKIHPDFQGFDLADTKLFPIWETIQDKFWIILHIGDKFSPDQNPSSPQKLAFILKNFPKLQSKLIIAHLGGYLHWQYALDYIIGQDIFLDTSSSLPFIPETILKQILARHNPEKILFGSDYPLFLPEKEKQRILEHPLLQTRFWFQLEQNSNNFLKMFLKQN